MIATLQDLADRLDIRQEEMALALQTCGVPAYLRSRIVSHGETNLCCKHNGKLERYCDTWARVTGEKWEKKRNSTK